MDNPQEVKNRSSRKRKQEEEKEEEKQGRQEKRKLWVAWPLVCTTTTITTPPSSAQRQHEIDRLRGSRRLLIAAILLQSFTKNYLPPCFKEVVNDLQLLLHPVVQNLPATIAALAVPSAWPCSLLCG